MSEKGSFISYSKAIFIESGRWILSLFDVFGIILLLFPELTNNIIADASITRIIGAAILFIGYTFANYSLYRKIISSTFTEGIIRIYPHRTNGSNAAKIYYTGSEPAKDVVIELEYVDNEGKSQRCRISQFFPDNDQRMLISSFNISELEPGQTLYFYLKGKKEVSGEFVNILITYKVESNGEKEIILTKRLPIK